MTERTLFDVVRELAHRTESHGIALPACSTEHVSRPGGDRKAYARELTWLAKAIATELAGHCECSIMADDGSGMDLLEHADIEGADLRLFAEALQLVGAELERLRDDADGKAAP